MIPGSVAPDYNDDSDYNEVLDLKELFDYSDYFTKDYSRYSNQQEIGKNYKVGVMSHRMVINYGEICLKVEKVKTYYSNTSIGSNTSPTVEILNDEHITNQLFSTKRVKLGILEMTEAAVNLEEISEVTTSTKFTKRFDLGKNVVYPKLSAELLYYESKLKQELLLTNIPNDKKYYSYSKVAIVLEFNIKSSYTEENRWFSGWNKLDNTVIENYKIKYYVADITAFCYNDNTFGDKVMGMYDLSFEKKY